MQSKKLKEPKDITTEQQDLSMLLVKLLFQIHNKFNLHYESDNSSVISASTSTAKHIGYGFKMVRDDLLNLVGTQTTVRFSVTKNIITCGHYTTYAENPNTKRKRHLKTRTQMPHIGHCHI